MITGNRSRCRSSVALLRNTKNIDRTPSSPTRSRVGQPFCFRILHSSVVFSSRALRRVLRIVSALLLSATLLCTRSCCLLASLFSCSFSFLLNGRVVSASVCAVNCLISSGVRHFVCADAKVAAMKHIIAAIIASGGGREGRNIFFRAQYYFTW